ASTDFSAVPAAAYASLAGWSARWADAGLRPCAPIARNLSSRSSFALYSTCSLIHRHCLRPRIVRRVVRHDPRPVHPGGPVNDGSFRRAIGAIQTAAATPATFLRKNQNKISGRRPQKLIQVAAVFPGPFVPARCLAKPIASFG